MIEDNELLRKCATSTFIDFLQTGIAGPWSIDNLPEGGPGSLFSAEPVSIYDINGELLFKQYQQDWLDDSDVLALTTHHKVFGSPVVTVGISQSFHLTQALGETTAYAESQNLVTKDAQPKVICYSYPKLGIAVTDQTGQELIIDIFTHSVIKKVDSQSPNEGAPGCWSLLDYANKTQKKGIFTRYNNISTRSINAHRVLSGKTNLDLKGNLADATQNNPLPQYCIPNITLCPQQSEEWCADAVAEMILAHYGIDVSQQIIANAFSTGVSGSTIQSQISGYSTISQGKYAAALSEPAVFENAKPELNSNRPVKSGIPMHARALGGWKGLGGTTSADSQEWLYVYDPYPPNTGNVYWEAWDSVFHTNFIFVRPIL